MSETSKHDKSPSRSAQNIPLQITVGAMNLYGQLSQPVEAQGLVLLGHCREKTDEASTFAQQRLIDLAHFFSTLGLATFVVDLSTPEEREQESQMGPPICNCELLRQRFIGLAEYLVEYPATRQLSIGYLSLGIGGAAALIAAAERPDLVTAVVSVNGRVDLACSYLHQIIAPTLLIVPGEDELAMKMNQEAMKTISAQKQLVEIPGVTTLFSDPTVSETIGWQIGDWFHHWLVKLA
ncbi:hypothetical protein [Tengunoibacter tsumagoiensis]|uniref:Dienelactone hydrolase domain-containing protein n=1 Tax=Tengunoibacter tsumagoiensis TaxID=2014871 RepID=A0A402A3V0_9CHLR|nr:hypothetical protein [Tengunoibacter tsumagoiensis]GCE13823.1 hypothetical protein KTT_36820 [Tengunoibacter tsumagoiensis]